MTVIGTPKMFTADDVRQLSDHGLYELVDGQLIEKEMSELANETAGLIVTALVIHCRPAKLGRVLPQQTFQCFPHDPDRLRRPDVAFILAGRLPDERFPDHVPLLPDIAVEVVSPNDSAYELEQKLADYRRAGLSLTWVVYPEQRTLLIHRPDRSVTRLVDGDTLTGESILPGFAVQLAELLPIDQAKK